MLAEALSLFYRLWVDEDTPAYVKPALAQLSTGRLRIFLHLF